MAYIDWPKVEGVPPTSSFDHGNFATERTKPDGSIVRTKQWIESQTDGTTILEHASAFDGAYTNTPGARRGHPDVMCRVADKAVNVWGFNPSRGKRSHETKVNLLIRRNS